MADGSMHSMAYVAESSYGVTPATPVFTPLRHRGTTLALSKDTLESEEIRSDRQRTDVRHGAKKVGGDVEIELSYGTFDTVLEALLGGTWAVKATKTATTISAAAADNSYNDSGNGFVTAGFEVGDIVVVTGFTGSAANNIARGVLTSVAAGKIIVGGTDGDVIVDDEAGESVTIATVDYKLKAGTTRRSFTIERHFADILDKPYHRATGCEFNTGQFAINANAMITGTLGIIGRDYTINAGIVSGATYSAASTTSPLDSFTGALKEGGSAVAVVTEMQLNVDNGMAERMVVGSPYSLQPSIGRSNVSGQVTVYFENSTMLEKFINETESSLVVNLPDGAGNNLRIVLPRVKYQGGPPDVKGEGPITLSMQFQALLDSTTSTNIMLVRTPHA